MNHIGIQELRFTQPKLWIHWKVLALDTLEELIVKVEDKSEENNQNQCWKNRKHRREK